MARRAREPGRAARPPGPGWGTRGLRERGQAAAACCPQRGTRQEHGWSRTSTWPGGAGGGHRAPSPAATPVLRGALGSRSPPLLSEQAMMDIPVRISSLLSVPSIPFPSLPCLISIYPILPFPLFLFFLPFLASFLTSLKADVHKTTLHVFPL